MMTDQEVIDRLRSLPPAVVSRDLVPDILTRAKAEKSARIIPLVAAAATALLLGGFWIGGTISRDPARQAAAWLVHAQAENGSWSAAKLGGSQRFEVALAGLALMTLLDGPVGNRSAIDKATGFLVRQQQTDGRFGELFDGTPYNQAIATLALARVYETSKDAVLRQALDKAIMAICNSQAADGGWGYSLEYRQASNLSITLWQIEALRLAAQLGWPQVSSRVARGLHWMAGVAADDGSFGYEKRGDTAAEAAQTLTAMGAMSLLDPAHSDMVSPARRQAIKTQLQGLALTAGPDMDHYRRYFLVAALKHMNEEPALRGLQVVRHGLVARQVKQGAEAGSWKADDRWGSSGGRVYATAMASLSLR